MAIVRAHRGIMPEISDEAFIAENAVIIGDVKIGPGSSIWYGCVLRGDVNKIRVGRNTNIQDGSVVHCNHDRDGDYRETGGGMPTFIGDDVTIGHMALIHACRLEDGAFVGMSATVTDMAVVQGAAMVGAGALVPPGKTVLKGQLWAGVPAKHRRDLSPEEQAANAHIAKHYAEMAALYRSES